MTYCCVRIYRPQKSKNSQETNYIGETSKRLLLSNGGKSSLLNLDLLGWEESYWCQTIKCVSANIHLAIGRWSVPSQAQHCAEALAVLSSASCRHSCHYRYLSVYWTADICIAKAVQGDLQNYQCEVSEQNTCTCESWILLESRYKPAHKGCNLPGQKLGTHTVCEQQFISCSLMHSRETTCSTTSRLTLTAVTMCFDND